ncbi:TIGR03899 family protein [Salinimonas sp. HHU 13199]|uniref:TIGR03899 family protein n=1 Tax=Salinimonas profundi TaxID=2729140 RepID=A0ABR8LL11_9ALTE|nr:TIGR03899 family protein [Salinimonas profundi]MBD3586893.1 TIGR03899 family protein [Salinimonas profundi]
MFSKPTSDNLSDKTSNFTKPGEKTGTSDFVSAGAEKLDNWFMQSGIDINAHSRDVNHDVNAVEKRLRAQALNRINNLKRIGNIAKNVSINASSHKELDPDWFFAFLSLAENVYSPAMQELWGKILAVELSAPGSFSLRSLETIRLLTERDAQLFRRAVSIASWPARSAIPRILVGYYRRRAVLEILRSQPPGQLNLSSFGLSYPDLLALIDLKLIFASEIESSELKPDAPVTWRCGRQSYSLQAKKAGTALVYYKLTSVGAELFRLFEKKQTDDYLTALFQLMSPAFHVEHDN